MHGLSSEKWTLEKASQCEVTGGTGEGGYATTDLGKEGLLLVVYGRGEKRV